MAKGTKVNTHLLDREEDEATGCIYSERGKRENRPSLTLNLGRNRLALVCFPPSEGAASGTGAGEGAAQC